MRHATLVFCLAAMSGCSFIDDFDSFHQPDGGGVDASADGGRSDGGDSGPAPDGGPGCATGTMDCDHNPATACTDVTTSRANCGTCGHPCAAGQSCVASTCAPDPVVQLAAGASHACALHMSGQIQCWGLNAYGQLGIGVASPSEDLPRDVVGLPEPAVEIAAGNSHTCARSAAGHVFCWGQNYAGELGNGTATGDFTPNPTPQTVLGVANALAIALGYDSTCALIGPTATARVECWGNNSYGELGQNIADHPSSSSPLPVTLSGAVIPTGIACGRYDEYTCATVMGTGRAQCWGGDDHDELGVGRVAGPTPDHVAGSDGAIDVRGGDTHVCARSPTSALLCWGLGDSGELGRPLATSTDPLPTAVPMLTAVTSYGVGRSHTCAVGTYAVGGAGHVYCFGSNSQGELGIGGMTSMMFSTPQLVDSAGVFVEVVAGDDFSCARRNDVATGAVLCWGRNASGETGTGDSGASDPRHLSPIAVVGL